MNFHVLCIKSIWRQYICFHLIKVLPMFTRVLLGPVNSRFPIEFTKAFSQLNLYKYQFFFVNVKVFYIHNVFWLIRPCSFFRNVRFFSSLFCWTMLFIYYDIYNNIQSEVKKKCELRLLFLATQQMICSFLLF